MNVGIPWEGIKLFQRNAKVLALKKLIESNLIDQDFLRGTIYPCSSRGCKTVGGQNRRSQGKKWFFDSTLTFHYAYADGQADCKARVWQYFSGDLIFQNFEPWPLNFANIFIFLGL